MNDEIRTGPRVALSPQQEQWATAVRKLLNIATETQVKVGGKDGVYETDSLHRRFEEREAESTLVKQKELRREIEDKKAERIELDRKLKAARREEDWETASQLQNDIDEIDGAIEESKIRLERMGLAVEQLKIVRKVEGKLDKQLKTVGKEIQTLTDTLANGGDAVEAREKATGKISSKDAEAFRFAYDGVAKGIEHAIREVFPMIKRIPVKDGPPVEEERHYTAIDSTEYAILYGMLEKAELVLLTQGLKPALAAVEQAKTALETYRAARTGATLVTGPETTGTPLDEEFMEVEGCEAMLRGGGFRTAADALRIRREALVNQILDAIDKEQGDRVGPLMTATGTLVEDARAALSTMREIEGELAGVREIIRVFRANEDTNFAGGAQRWLDEFDRLRPLDDCLEDAREMRALFGETKESQLESHLEEPKIDREELRRRAVELRQLYESLFKKDKHGNIKEIVDTQTRQLKGDKKNSKLPREAIREFELMLLAAEQLVESGSVDALKKADMWLSGTKTAMQNAIDSPDTYVNIDLRIKWLETRLKDYGSKYPLYLVGRRSDLQMQLADIRSRDKTVFQAEINKEITLFSKELDKLREEIIKLQAKKRALAKDADAVEKVLGEIGSLLKSSFSDKSTKFEGYHGGFAERLAQVRENIAKRQPDTLNDADTELRKLETEAPAMLDLLNRDLASRRTKKPGPPLEFDEISKVLNFLKDARNGQKEHNDREAKHGEFNEKRESLRLDIEKLLKTCKKLRTDPTEVELLKERRTAIRNETKSTRDYPKGIKDLESLRTEFETAKRSIEGAEQILDKSLVQIAADVKRLVGELDAEIKGFVGRVKAKGGDDYDQLGSGKQKKLDDYCNGLSGVLAGRKPELIAQQAAIVADGTGAKPLPERKLARKAALAEVRALAGVVGGFAPMDHFARNTFGGSEALGTLRSVLTRLELKLLTAIEG